MVKERSLVVGPGEVGRPLFELLRESGKFEVYGSEVTKRRCKRLSKMGYPVK